MSARRHNLRRRPTAFVSAGFTLIEALVYIAVLLIATGAVISTFFSLRDVFERNRIERELADAGTQILERISREVRRADGLDVGSSFSISPGVLSLSEGTDKVEFFVGADGRVQIEENDGTPSPISPRAVTVSSLVFRHYAHDPGESEAVRAEVTLRVASPYASSTKTFYTTAVMRGTYE